MAYTTYGLKEDPFPIGTAVYWGGNLLDGTYNIICGVCMGNGIVHWKGNYQKVFSSEMRNRWDKVFDTPLEAMMYIIKDNWQE